METQPRVLSASTIIGDTVVNPDGEKLGDIRELMIDLEFGQVAYAVLSFGGFFGLGDKLFAIPWQALTILPEEHAFLLEIDKETLKDAPGFDKDNWPETTDRTWTEQVYSYYGYAPYWTDR
jgi:sporulation protein YlmC with PRC-barrel domain